MLKTIVFLAGATLMGLEIAGSRLMAPYFGNSVFVWGSLIGVLLTALSAGAYVGGWTADQAPDARLLAGLLAIAGGVVLAMPWTGPAVNRAVFLMDLGPRVGPLVASFALFMMPGLVLGSVSPFIIRMEVSGLSRVGRVAGTISALSTAGSIAGTLLTSFYLIPALGVRHILLILGGCLLLLALLAVIAMRGRNR